MNFIPSDNQVGHATPCAAIVDEVGEGILPGWCKRENLVYAFELSEPTPSNNVIKNMHWQTYKRLRQEWRLRVFVEGLNARHVQATLEKSALVVVRRCSGSLDWDNAYGGLKPVLDCLVKRTPRNPDGLGLILDDNPSSMPYPPLLVQRPAKRGAGSTLVLVFKLDN